METKVIYMFWRQICTNNWKPISASCTNNKTLYSQTTYWISVNEVPKNCLCIIAQILLVDHFLELGSSSEQSASELWRSVVFRVCLCYIRAEIHWKHDSGLLWASYCQTITHTHTDTHTLTHSQTQTHTHSQVWCSNSVTINTICLLLYLLNCFNCFLSVCSSLSLMRWVTVTSDRRAANLLIQWNKEMHTHHQLLNHVVCERD